MEDNGYMMN